MTSKPQGTEFIWKKRKLRSQKSRILNGKLYNTPNENVINTHTHIKKLNVFSYTNYQINNKINDFPNCFSVFCFKYDTPVCENHAFCFGTMTI